MDDLGKLADDVTTRAATAAGRDAARRAVESLLSSDEDKAQKEAEHDAASKSRRNKLIAYGVVGLLLLLGVVGFVMSYWQWFFLLGLLGVAALYGWHRLRKLLRARKSKPESVADASATRDTNELRVEDTSGRNQATPEEEVRARALKRREERARAAHAREEGRAVEEQELDDELAAMKARLDR